MKLIVVDTPPSPYIDSDAQAAVEVADLVLIPCRFSASDLAAIHTIANLVQLLRKTAGFVFTVGLPNTPHVYEAAAELFVGYGDAGVRGGPARPRCLLPRQRQGPQRHRHRTYWQGRRRRPRNLRLNVSTIEHADLARGRPMIRQPSVANLRTNPPAKPASAPREVAPGNLAAKTPNKPQSREGRKQIAGFFTPEMSFAMHMLARRRGSSLQTRMAEAFNDVLRKYGESPVGK